MHAVQGHEFLSFEAGQQSLLQLPCDDMQHAIQQGVNDSLSIQCCCQNEELRCLSEATAVIHQCLAPLQRDAALALLPENRLQRLLQGDCNCTAHTLCITQSLIWFDLLYAIVTGTHVYTSARAIIVTGRDDRRPTEAACPQ